MVLLAELRERREATIAQLVAALAEQGYRLAGRASKVVSDALRWETAPGRVTRVGRGRYRYRQAPRSRIRRARVFVRRCRTWLVAVTRGEVPPPMPPNPRPGCGWFPPQPSDPPWSHYGWLWVT